jgi:hypothetical protein
LNVLKSANDLINRDLTQELFDLANYTVEAKHGEEVVNDVRSKLSSYFSLKQEAAIVILILNAFLFISLFV